MDATLDHRAPSVRSPATPVWWISTPALSAFRDLHAFSVDFSAASPAPVNVAGVPCVPPIPWRAERLVLKGHLGARMALACCPSGRPSTALNAVRLRLLALLATLVWIAPAADYPLAGRTTTSNRIMASSHTPVPRGQAHTDPGDPLIDIPAGMRVRDKGVAYHGLRRCRVVGTVGDP